MAKRFIYILLHSKNNLETSLQRLSFAELTSCVKEFLVNHVNEDYDLEFGLGISRPFEPQKIVSPPLKLNAIQMLEALEASTSIMEPDSLTQENSLDATIEHLCSDLQASRERLGIRDESELVVLSDEFEMPQPQTLESLFFANVRATIVRLNDVSLNPETAMQASMEWSRAAILSSTFDNCVLLSISREMVSIRRMLLGLLPTRRLPSRLMFPQSSLLENGADFDTELTCAIASKLLAGRGTVSESTTRLFEVVTRIPLAAVTECDLFGKPYLLHAKDTQESWAAVLQQLHKEEDTMLLRSQFDLESNTKLEHAIYYIAFPILEQSGFLLKAMIAAEDTQVITNQPLPIPTPAAQQQASEILLSIDRDIEFNPLKYSNRKGETIEKKIRSIPARQVVALSSIQKQQKQPIDASTKVKSQARTVKPLPPRVRITMPE